MRGIRGNRFGLLVFVATLAAAWWLQGRAPAFDVPRRGPCRVLRVTDGDTLLVSCDGFGERVRLLQVDTPERGEPLYREAGEALAAWIGDEPVWLEPWREERDVHDRLLAYVFVGERNLCVALIEAGLSPYFDRYGAGRYPREMRAAERVAREARRGIWADARPR